MQQIRDILNTGFTDKGTQYKFYKHDVKIFFGDLNFRINLPYYTVMDTIDEMAESNKKANMGVLLSNDQLNQCKHDFPWLDSFKEMPITFLPTYKYDKNSHSYDTSKKMRVPSWTDRILWYVDEEDHSNIIKPILYERRESLFSDHRPVVGYFEINSQKHNNERKQSFKRKIISAKATSFIVKKPTYNPVESKVNKEFDDFDIFNEPTTGTEKPIHLDLNFSTKPNSNEESKVSSNRNDMIDDLLHFDNNLIKINEKKDDGNLIDFGSTPPMRPHPGMNYFQKPMMQPMYPVRPVHPPAIHHANSYNMHISKPAPANMARQYNSVSMHNKSRASVPRKQSEDLFEVARSNNMQPAKKNQATEDFFSFS